ncbi:MAG: RtcB family protein [Planctomycetota bacterium]|nr:MAG: RtcB family protein [Planctomycetota bacterium]
MDLAQLRQRSAAEWEIPVQGGMRVPVVLYGSRQLLLDMDEKVREQACNVACLPGILQGSFVMPDGHWGYGFPIGGVAAFDPEEGVVSAGGVGFDISCGVRCLLLRVTAEDVRARREALAEALAGSIPAGVGSRSKLLVAGHVMDAMLRGGARWAVEHGYGRLEDLGRIEENGCHPHARPEFVSAVAKQRQEREVGTLGSGNHYLEVQRVGRIDAPALAAAFELREGDAVLSIHCGSRGMGHQIGTDFLARMAVDAGRRGLALPDRELACAPVGSELGQEYLGAMRAAVNCALANRQVLTHFVRQVFAHVLPEASVELLFDVSHNTCKEEEHVVAGRLRKVFVHRKGATRAFPPGHASLPSPLRGHGQPVLIGGSMGTGSYVLAGAAGNDQRAFSSACHGAGRSMSRHQALRRWRGQELVRELAERGILIRSPSMRGVAEEAPGAYKDLQAVVDAAEEAGLARKVARLEPMICIKG